MNIKHAGVFQLENGFWGYRYTYTENGKRKDVKRKTDKYGNLFKTERAAVIARDEEKFHFLCDGS